MRRRRSKVRGGPDASNRRQRRYPRTVTGLGDDGRGSKYGASKIRQDGYVFDSKKEHARYVELKILERAGVISNLEVHPSWHFTLDGQEFVVIRSKGAPNGRKAKYTADFKYVNEHRRLVVEDVKGMDLGESRLRRALMEFFHGIRVEVI